MKVRATARGYYGRIREPGDEFSLKDAKDFSDNWMEKVEAAKGRKSQGKTEGEGE